MPDNINNGEAGHAGQDRQPVKNADSHVRGPAPDPAQAATPAQVQSRSDHARANLKAGAGADRKDQLHPAPSRDKSQKSRGKAHHDQHESEPPMDKKVEKL